MKNILVILFLTLAATFASASDLSLHHGAVPAPESATGNPEPAASAGNVSTVEAGAANIGAFLGGLVGGTVNMGKAFVDGIRKGYSDDPASEDSTPIESAKASTDSRESTVLGLFNPATLVAKLSQRSQGTSSAPIEEKSTVAVNMNY